MQASSHLASPVANLSMAGPAASQSNGQRPPRHVSSHTSPPTHPVHHRSLMHTTGLCSRRTTSCGSAPRPTAAGEEGRRGRCCCCSSCSAAGATLLLVLVKATGCQLIAAVCTNAAVTPPFHPAYWCSSECTSQCIHKGRYCSPDPDGNLTQGYSGSDVVQVCCWDVLPTHMRWRTCTGSACCRRPANMPTYP